MPSMTIAGHSGAGGGTAGATPGQTAGISGTQTCEQEARLFLALLIKHN